MKMKLERSAPSWKDMIEEKVDHPTITRRDLLARGMATGVLTMGISKMLGGDLIKQAVAQTMNCPAPVRNPGAIAQIFSNGGPTMGARFISEAQAAAMNTNMAGNYGITGSPANLIKLGPNMVVDQTSPFGFTLMQGPPGYPGGAAGWQKNVLTKISGGGHLGPFNADDGAGQNGGLVGGVGTFKSSVMGKDLLLNTSVTPAPWAKGLPSSSVSKTITSASLASTFSLTPPANGLTNAAAFNSASDTANALALAMAPVTGTTTRKAGTDVMTKAGCAFYGNTALADPAYGSTLFTPNATNTPKLAANVTLTALTAQEQAQIAAFYQSASGVAGGIVQEFDGRDYHGQSPQTSIAPADIEEARTIVMFLAACDAAGAPGAMLYFANGQAIANGTTAVTATINGTTVNLNAPTAQGDAGGSYNAGLIIFYDPKGAPPAARFTGTVSSTSGNATNDPNVGSVPQAVGGLYLSALKWVTGSIPNSALQVMQAVGVAGTPANVIVI